MARLSLAVLVLFLAVVTAEKPACKAEKERVRNLEKEVSELQAKIKDAEARMGGTAVKLSVLGAATAAKSLIGNGIQSAMDSTDLDEKVTEKASAHFESARSMTVDAMGQVSAIDFNEYVNQMKQHAIYKEHVAPAMESAAKKAEPFLTQHVNPALETHVYPAMNKIKAVSTEVADTHMPTLQAHKAKVVGHLSGVPTMCSQLEAKVADGLAPIFTAMAKVSPDVEQLLPSGGVDRVCFLIVALVISYYFLFLAKFVISVTLRVTTKTTSIVFKLAVILPLRIIGKFLSIITCFATCFYCCGLCRSKRVSADTSDKKGKPGAKKDENASKNVTVEELTQLLEASKKKGKIDDAVKLLCTKEKEGKALEGKSFPENVRGKAVDKATLKKAFGKFKEINVKL